MVLPDQFKAIVTRTGQGGIQPVCDLLNDWRPSAKNHGVVLMPFWLLRFDWRKSAWECAAKAPLLPTTIFSLPAAFTRPTKIVAGRSPFAGGFTPRTSPIQTERKYHELLY
jgi:hypothetical protein